jgi:hypothetical protein
MNLKEPPDGGLVMDERMVTMSDGRKITVKFRDTSLSAFVTDMLRAWVADLEREEGRRLPDGGTLYLEQGYLGNPEMEPTGRTRSGSSDPS